MIEGELSRAATARYSICFFYPRCLPGNALPALQKMIRIVVVRQRGYGQHLAGHIRRIYLYGQPFVPSQLGQAKGVVGDEVLVHSDMALHHILEGLLFKSSDSRL